MVLQQELEVRRSGRRRSAVQSHGYRRFAADGGHAVSHDEIIVIGVDQAAQIAALQNAAEYIEAGRGNEGRPCREHSAVNVHASPAPVVVVAHGSKILAAMLQQVFYLL